MKTYKAVISFGDGRPFETTIEAKNGQAAQDAGFKAYPGARVVRISGILSERLPANPPKPTPHVFFEEPTPVTTNSLKKSSFLLSRDELVAEAIKLRKRGLSYLKISTELSVGKTTVRRWMFEAKVP